MARDYSQMKCATNGDISWALRSEHTAHSPGEVMAFNFSGHSRPHGETQLRIKDGKRACCCFTDNLAFLSSHSFLKDEEVEAHRSHTNGLPKDISNE